MSAALKKVNECPAVASDRGGLRQVLKAKPKQNKPDYDAIRDRIKVRFSRTLAYLAK